jgi:hypothetical protein
MISGQASSLSKRSTQFFQRHIKIQCREIKTGAQQGSLNIVGVEVVVQSKHPINRSLPCEVSDDAGLPRTVGAGNHPQSSAGYGIHVLTPGRLWSAAT